MFRHIFTSSTKFYFLFSSALQNQLSKYLSNHVIKIIKSKPQAFTHCQTKLKTILDKCPSHQPKAQQQNSDHDRTQSIKSKMNMVFRIYSLPAVLEKYKDELSNMVIDDKIANQSDLDRICAILTKKIKVNKDYQMKDIEDMRKEAHLQRQQFCRVVNQLKESNQQISIPEVSKLLRQRFITIQSKEIYEKLKVIQQEKLVKSADINQSISHESPKQKPAKQFWDKLQNIKPRLLAEECNDAQTYKKHLEITEGKLRFRFPPQPNGYLHIGHIKSIRINFETAKRNGGICFLRYDDTNPQTQAKQYIDNILKNVRWLGYEPDHITYASDYFQKMLEYAVQLIKQGDAYVCDSSQIQIQRQRKQKLPNKHRNRPIEQSLQMFPNLQQGQTLRLKLDPQSKNPTLRDPVIYRIKDHAHPRTGTKYRVYPIYDFAHCICDSLEHIDYSLCSLEFQVRRELYYRILDLLKLYKPIVWEYSRLNVQGSVISKRKIKALIQSHAIDSWSDPRLLTIGGLINRGYTPNMLISFIDKVNASRAGNQNIIQYSLLQRQMRRQLFKTSQKSMMVLNPQLLTIQPQSFPQHHPQQSQTTVQLYTDPTRKQHRKLQLSNRIYVENQKQLFEVGKIVVLKYFGGFQVVGVEGGVVRVRRVLREVKSMKQDKVDYKVIHWISEHQSCRVPVTVFDKLLDTESKMNETSKTVYENALIPIEVYQQSQNTHKYWQMERLGYFKFDQQGNFIRCTSLQ